MSSAIALTSTAAAVNTLAAVRAFAFLGSSPNLPTSFLTRAAPDDATCAEEAGERNVGRLTPREPDGDVDSVDNSVMRQPVDIAGS